MSPEPVRVLSFVGTIEQLLRYLKNPLDLTREDAGLLSWGEAYEWELTASISRHPAGKGLRADG